MIRFLTLFLSALALSASAAQAAPDARKSAEMMLKDIATGWSPKALLRASHPQLLKQMDDPGQIAVYAAGSYSQLGEPWYFDPCQEREYRKSLPDGKGELRQFRCSAVFERASAEFGLTVQPDDKGMWKLRDFKILRPTTSPLSKN